MQQKQVAFLQHFNNFFIQNDTFEAMSLKYPAVEGIFQTIFLQSNKNTSDIWKTATFPSFKRSRNDTFEVISLSTYINVLLF